MNIAIYDKVGDVKIFGGGDIGGKGQGLVRINECKIPLAHKLKTRILTTAFFDRFLDQQHQFHDDELDVFKRILTKLKNTPISVRSSATNEGALEPGCTGHVHAGENTSFMLPNNHPDMSLRLNQLVQAITIIYEDFIHKQPPYSTEKMAIVINPIPGILDETDVGPIYYPMVSGVANSFFPYALKTQEAGEGFARLAFGHGYATVIDDFPVLSMATIRNPIPQKYLGAGQSFFYALDMTKNETLNGPELETMKKLHARFSSYYRHKFTSLVRNKITLEDLVHHNQYDFKDGLEAIMNFIKEHIAPRFQIEFIFNITEADDGSLQGVFHVVQLTQLPEVTFDTIEMPEEQGHTYLSISNLQGHGIKKDITKAIVVSPFVYSKLQHDTVCSKIAEMNRTLKEDGIPYIIIVPGRLGSSNRDWGIQVDYRDVDQAVGIFEYGVDVAGRSEPVAGEDKMTGGIYGSHFLYMIQGGHDETEKRLKTRRYGTQGTHFLTNLMAQNVIFGYITPGQDTLDPWFFAHPHDPDAPVYMCEFPGPVSIYADSKSQQCRVILENEQ